MSLKVDVGTQSEVPGPLGQAGFSRPELRNGNERLLLCSFWKGLELTRMKLGVATPSGVWFLLLRSVFDTREAPFESAQSSFKASEGVFRTS